MGDEFRFDSSEDLIFYINNNAKMRWTGTDFIPYGKVPLTFWMFERQLTGNNCFWYHAPQNNMTYIRELSRQYKNEFLDVKEWITLELVKLPVSKINEFNDLAERTHLKYQNDLSDTELVLEDNQVVMYKGKNISPGVREDKIAVRKFCIDDIVNINKEYRNCMLSHRTHVVDDEIIKVNNNLELGIYDILAEIINWELLKRESI